MRLECKYKAAPIAPMRCRGAKKPQSNPSWLAPSSALERWACVTLEGLCIIRPAVDFGISCRHVTDCPQPSLRRLRSIRFVSSGLCLWMLYVITEHPPQLELRDGGHSYCLRGRRKNAQPLLPPHSISPYSVSHPNSTQSHPCPKPHKGYPPALHLLGLPCQKW